MKGHSEMRPIAGHEGRYSVTADGRVWSHPKTFGRGGPRHGRWLSAGKNSRGYLVVRLFSEGAGSSACVHVLVATAFLQKPASLKRLEVNHISGVKTDNRAENLEWVTRAANVQHAHRIGLHPLRPSHRRLLTGEQARSIRELQREGVMQKTLAAQFGVSKCVINGIVRNRFYKGD